MAHITFEQFLQYTNAEELILQKLKEAGTKIFKKNYDQKLKHCKVLYEKFFDVKLRNKVFKYGLIIKPMPNSFRAKFLEFSENNNNDGDHNKSVTAYEQLGPNIIKETHALEDKYENDMPSTSTAFVHKPRLSAPTENPTNAKKPKFVPKRLSFEMQKSANKSQKITNYFSSNTNERPYLKRNMKLQSKHSDVSNENIETEPQTKIARISPNTQIKSKKKQNDIKLKVGPLSSKKNAKSANKTNRAKRKNDCFEEKNRKQRLSSNDFVSDDPDISANNSIISKGSNKEQTNYDGKSEQNASPCKSVLPKRNRTEDYGNATNLKESRVKTQSKNGFSKDDIELWIKNGQKALEDIGNINESQCDGSPCHTPITFREDVIIKSKLQSIKTNAEKYKKYTKFWLKLEINLRKSINSGPTFVSETSTAKLLSAFSQMEYEEFKNLVNIQKHISHWKLLGKSINDAEQIFKNQYTVFIKKEKPWPPFQIELTKLQYYLLKKGCKGPILLKYIPPRLLSFDEILERTNIKERISLSCDQPPDSYKQLLDLCKKEYEKCCFKGVWTEGLEIVKNSEACGSSEEISIELFPESSMIMSSLKVIECGHLQHNGVQKECPVTENVDGYRFESKPSNNDQHDFSEIHNIPSNGCTIKKKKSYKCRPKSRQNHSSKTYDNIELQLSYLCREDEPGLQIENQQLHKSIVDSQSQSPLKCMKGKIPVCSNSVTNSLEKIIARNPIRTEEEDATNQPFKKENFLTPSPNIFTCSDETNSKFTKDTVNNIQSKNEQTLKNLVTDLPSALSPNIFQSSGESNSKYNENIQTQESIYIPCKSYNDLNTEQSNFSININEVIGNKDPFGEIVINENQTKNINRDQRKKQTACDSVNTSLSEFYLLENSTSPVDKTTRNIIEFEPNVLLKQSLSCCRTATSHEVLANTDDQNQASNTSSHEKSFNQSNPVTVNKSNNTATYTNNTTNLGENIEKSATNPISTDPEQVFNKLTTDLVQNRNKDIQNDNLESVTLNRIPQENSVQIAGSKNDLNGSERITSNPNKVSNKDNNYDLKNKETESNSLSFTEPESNVFIKREIVSQQYSDYDDDVKIIDIHQPEAVVIDDEETTTELLEMLLCNSSPNKIAPMTILHTNISHAASSIYLDNFPQAQQIPSNFDLTQSQQILNKSSMLSTPGQVYNQDESQSSHYQAMSKTLENECNISDCRQSTTPSTPNNIVINNSSSKTENIEQLSEETIETSYKSVMPQKIPSDIEFSQTSLKKVMGQNVREPLNPISMLEVNAKDGGNSEQNSGQSIPNPKQINESSQRKQNIQMKTIEFLNVHTGEHSGINEKVSEELVTTLADSMDKSSDVEFLEIGTDDEISNKNSFQCKKMHLSREQHEPNDEFSSVPEKENIHSFDVSNSEQNNVLGNTDSSIEIVCVDDSEDSTSGSLKNKTNIEAQSILIDDNSLPVSSKNQANFYQELCLDIKTTEEPLYNEINKNVSIFFQNTRETNLPEQKINKSKDQIYDSNQSVCSKSIQTQSQINGNNGSSKIQIKNTSNQPCSSISQVQNKMENSPKTETYSMKKSLNKTIEKHAVNINTLAHLGSLADNKIENAENSKTVDSSVLHISSGNKSIDQTDEKLSHTKPKEIPCVKNKTVVMSKVTKEKLCFQSKPKENLMHLNVSTGIILHEPQTSCSMSLNLGSKSPVSVQATKTQEESIDKTFENSKQVLNDYDHCNEVINVNCKSSKVLPHKKLCNQENLQSSKALQKQQLNNKNVINDKLKKNCVLSENNSQEHFVTEEQSLTQVECNLKSHLKSVEQQINNQGVKIRNVNNKLRPRSISDNMHQKNVSTFTLSNSQPTKPNYSKSNKEPIECIKSRSKESILKPSEATKDIIVEPKASNLTTLGLQGLIPLACLEKVKLRNDNFVEIPVLIDKQFLNIIPQINTLSALSINKFTHKSFAIKISINFQIDEQQISCMENHISMPRESSKTLTSSPNLCKDKKIRKTEEEFKTKTKIPQPSTSKKKPTPKKSSKLPDFVQQKTHAFSSIPLKSCSKTSKSKTSSLLVVEECDYLIEDSSQAIITPTASQILGTDCTYFENSELLRNLEGISIPVAPELQIIEFSSKDPPSPPSTCKVNNLIEITLSEGVTARKVWQVNLQWKSRKAMSIEVKFSVNRRTMTACDEPAKLLFNFSQNIWSDVQRILREIDRFEYKRRAFKNQLKNTSLHKVLQQLFDSSTQIVNVKLTSDSYNPFIICEKTVPMYRKPFQCLSKGINSDILHKIKLTKENLQKIGNNES